MKPTYTAIDANNLPMTPGDHHAVRVEHPLLASPIIVTAQRSPKRMSHAEATKWAESLTTTGWSWRLPTVEEAFLICDRTREGNALPAAEFPDCEGEWIWTSTPCAFSSGAAWVVGLGYGLSGWYYHGGGDHARAVRAGQF